MKNIILTKLTLLIILLTVAHPLYAVKIKCWTDENGNLACGDFVPPNYSQKGFIVFNELGIKIKDVERAPTLEEIAKLEAVKQKKLKQEEQRKKDEELLALFSTERDINRSRTAALSSIDGKLQSLQSILDALKGNLDELSISYERSQNNVEVSPEQLEAIQRNIDRVKKRIENNETTLQDKLKEREEINREYDGYLERYRDIMQRRSGVQINPVQKNSVKPTKF